MMKALRELIPSDKYSEAFDLIVQYAERERWIPIGWREWTVGPWRIQVNGTRQTRDGVPPFHAFVENQTYVGMMLLHARGGTVGGYENTEAEFIEAMRETLNRKA